eukprot:SAG31_NODE_19139_length_611_cov_0.792969_1_plen_116_part_10
MSAGVYKATVWNSEHDIIHADLPRTPWELLELLHRQRRQRRSVVRTGRCNVRGCAAPASTARGAVSTAAPLSEFESLLLYSHHGLATTGKSKLSSVVHCSAEGATLAALRDLGNTV